MRKTLFAALAFIASPSVHAEIGTGSHSSQTAHVHGAAELTLAIDGSAIEIDFQSPAVNLVGFEHKASTKKQKKAVHDAKSRLQNAEQLFIFSGNTCSLTKVSMDLSSLIDVEKNHHKDHDDASTHDSHEKHDEHDEHDEHDTHKEHNDNHSEIRANYAYSCSKEGDIDSLAVELFKFFPDIETINTQWITGSGQGGAALTTSNNTITLR